jgi:hypothetical protein
MARYPRIIPRFGWHFRFCHSVAKFITIAEAAWLKFATKVKAPGEWLLGSIICEVEA